MRLRCVAQARFPQLAAAAQVCVVVAIVCSTHCLLEFARHSCDIAAAADVSTVCAHAGTTCNSRYSGSGSGGRIGIAASTVIGTLTTSACGGPNTGMGAGSGGTVFYSVGPDLSNRVRSLYVSNCAYSAGQAVLSDPGRALYMFDLIRLTSTATLSVLPVSVALGTFSNTTTTVLSGDGTGRFTINDVTFLQLSATYTVVGVELNVLGVLAGASALTMDTSSTLTLTSTGRTLGLSSGQYLWSSLTLVRVSVLQATSITALTVTNTFTVLDTSSISLNTGAFRS